MEKIRLDRISVLVVDDNEHITWLLRSILYELGCRMVVDCHEGGEAFRRFINEQFDLVLTNWEMRPVDGITLVKRIRTDEDSPNRFVPVIMISAHSSRERVLFARDSGINEFLTKPFSVRTLFRRILEVVARPRPYIRTKDYFGPDRRRHDDAKYSGPERRQDPGTLSRRGEPAGPEGEAEPGAET
ncbi:MAG: response regulator [Proteobacteria bacterium]|nr:response regulator [Pseudomonadota bacterium]